MHGFETFSVDFFCSSLLISVCGHAILSELEFQNIMVLLICQDNSDTDALLFDAASENN